MKNSHIKIIALFFGIFANINAAFAVDYNTSTAATAMPTTTPPSTVFSAMIQASQTPSPSLDIMQSSCTQYQKLSDEQKAKVDEIMRNLDEKITPLKSQILTKQEAINKQFMTPTPNEKTLSILTKEIFDLQTQIFTAHIQARLAAAKVGCSAEDCWKQMYPVSQQDLLPPADTTSKISHGTHGSASEAPFQGVQSSSSQGLQSGGVQGFSDNASQELGK